MKIWSVTLLFFPPKNSPCYYNDLSIHHPGDFCVTREMRANQIRQYWSSILCGSDACTLLGVDPISRSLCPIAFALLRLGPLHFHETYLPATTLTFAHIILYLYIIFFLWLEPCMVCLRVKFSVLSALILSLFDPQSYIQLPRNTRKWILRTLWNFFIIIIEKTKCLKMYHYNIQQLPSAFHKKTLVSAWHYS